MDYQKFLEELKEKVAEYFGDDFIIEVIIDDESKRWGLSIEQKGTSAVPRFYLEELYDKYLREKDMDICVELVAENYFDVVLEKMPDWDFLYHWHKVKELVFIHMVNFESHVEQLKGRAYRLFLDLAVSYELDLGAYLEGTGTDVTESLLEEWGITESELYEQAIENMTHYQKPHISNLQDIIDETYNDGMDDTRPAFNKENNLGEMTTDKKPCMYILTNEMRNKGVSSILCDDLLKSHSEKMGSDLYILPSSENEMMVVSADWYESPEELVEMIRDTNENLLEPEGVLSNNIYFYNKDMGEISIVDV